MILDDHTLLRLVRHIEANSFGVFDKRLKDLSETPEYSIIKQDTTFTKFLKDFLEAKVSYLDGKTFKTPVPSMEERLVRLELVYRKYEMYRRLRAFDNKHFIRQI